MNPNVKKLLTLSFLPATADAALLLLRAWLGLSILLILGLAKLQNFGATVATFHDKMGIPTPLAAAGILSETVCAALLVAGPATRWASVFLATTMAAPPASSRCSRIRSTCLRCSMTLPRAEATLEVGMSRR